MAIKRPEENNFFLWEAARGLSILAHPLLVPIYLLLYMLYFSSSPWSKLPMDFKSSVLFYISLGTTLIPLLWMGICIVFRVVSDIEMPSKAERFWPLLLSCITSFVTGIIAERKWELPESLTGIVYGTFAVLLVALVITPFWKISLHSMGMGALLCFVLMIGLDLNIDTGPGLYAIVFLSGIVGWARLYLIAHNIHQIIAGFCVGFACMCTTLLIL
ncbi:MAG: phosphatase PAP2 family protein [Bacteroidales bacterium]|nr:phosphatase PAP2 family protein [Bacteroidales bacterium]